MPTSVIFYYFLGATTEGTFFAKVTIPIFYKTGLKVVVVTRLKTR